MKKTNQQIINFFANGTKWLEENKEQTKFRYAVVKMVKRAQIIIGKYQEDIEDISVRNAATDDKGVLLHGSNGEAWAFTKEGLLNRNRERSALFRTEVEIDPYYATEMPEKLSAEDRELFDDFVIKPEAG